MVTNRQIRHKAQVTLVIFIFLFAINFVLLEEQDEAYINSVKMVIDAGGTWICIHPTQMSTSNRWVYSNSQGWYLMWKQVSTSNYMGSWWRLQMAAIIFL